MLSGKLDRRITIETCTNTVNSIGEWIPTWTALTQLWASIEFTDSKETFEAQQLVAPNELTFKTRYKSTVNERCRIVYNGYNYDILHIAEIGRREGLKIIARKKDNTVISTGSITVTEVIKGLPLDMTYFHVVLTGQSIEGNIAEGDVNQSVPITFDGLPFDIYDITVDVKDGYATYVINPDEIVISATELNETCTITHEKD